MEYLGVLVGWVLGLFSIPLGEKINWYCNKKSIKNAINLEFEELAVKLLLLSGRITLKHSLVTQEYIVWFMDGWNRIDTNTIPSEEIAIYELLKTRPVGYLNQYYKGESQTHGKGLAFKKLNLPYISQKINILNKFDSGSFISIINILNHIDSINESFNYYKQFFNLTFDENITGKNREINKNNSDNTMLAIKDELELTFDKTWDYLSK